MEQSVEVQVLSRAPCLFSKQKLMEQSVEIAIVWETIAKPFETDSTNRRIYSKDVQHM